MRNFIEARLNVSFQHPLCRRFPTQYQAALFYRIRRAALGPESLRIRVSGRFGNRVERQQVEHLHGSILHGSYP